MDGLLAAGAMGFDPGVDLSLYRWGMTRSRVPTPHRLVCGDASRSSPTPV
jgi:hypothetical protein